MPHLQRTEHGSHQSGKPSFLTAYEYNKILLPPIKCAIITDHELAEKARFKTYDKFRTTLEEMGNETLGNNSKIKKMNGQ